MPFTKQVHKQNSDGSVGMTLPANVTGPEGTEIEPGDKVTLQVLNVEKADNSEVDA